LKTNSELQRDVQNELNWVSSITAGEIGVTAKDGVVTLTGTVPNYFEKMEAEHIAGRVAGVMAIAEELKVQLPDFNERTDTDIAQSALNALAWNVAVPSDHAKVKVENGWVTLHGQVDWYYQKKAAENAVHYLMGVKGVTNSLTLKPRETITAGEIMTTIENAFKRTAISDAHKITVKAQNGKVTLDGNVHSWIEKDEAGEYAWTTPGVSSVENNIVVIN
jgi:osmotically-inducible protein OsmY